MIYIYRNNLIQNIQSFFLISQFINNDFRICLCYYLQKHCPVLSVSRFSMIEIRKTYYPISDQDLTLYYFQMSSNWNFSRLMLHLWWLKCSRWSYIQSYHRSPRQGSPRHAAWSSQKCSSLSCTVRTILYIHFWRSLN